MAKRKVHKRKKKTDAIDRLLRKLKVGTTIRITWEDVVMSDKIPFSTIKEPFDLSPTTNEGTIALMSRKYVVIVSERPHDPESQGTVATAFPMSIVIHSDIRVLKPGKKILVGLDK